MDYAQIIRNDTNTPVNLADEAGNPYAANDPQNPLIGQNELTQAINAEAQARQQQVTEAITTEAQARQGQINTVNGEIDKTNAVLAGVHTTTLEGALLNRTAGENVSVPRSLFADSTVFMAGKTLVFDADETQAVFIGDDPETDGNILLLTKTTKTPAPTHEVNVIDLASLGIAGLSGTLSWIVVNLSPQVSDASIWGTIITDDTVEAGYNTLLTVDDEPLFERFVGVVEKVALNIPADGEIGMLPYKYDENGLTLFIQKDGMQQSVSFQDRLFFVAE
jgi:hypothetical protein